MSKQATVAKIAPAANAAPVAPVSGQPEATTAKAERKSKGVISGPSFDRLVAAGASLIRLAGSKKLHDTVMAHLPPATPAAQLNERVAPLVKGWTAFDSGYLCGSSASYGADAVRTSSKKAKASPCFGWAVRPEGKTDPVLMTSDGQVWARPDKEGREQSNYDLLMGAARAAFSGE